LKRECSLELRSSKATIHELGFWIPRPSPPTPHYSQTKFSSIDRLFLLCLFYSQ
jgi:hypothetical protein